MKAFATKVYDSKVPTIDHGAYEMSQQSIEKQIAREKSKMKKAKDLSERERYKNRISLLKNIESALQIALETY